MKQLLYLFLLLLVLSCEKSGSEYLENFSNYYRASVKGDKAKWDYTTDTVKTWLDDKSGDPILSIMGKSSKGKWAEWDQVMNAETYYDTIWYNREEHAIQGYFYEKNDFYELIGKPPTKTLKTYWFNDQNKISEVLIYWIPEDNRLTSEYLEPVVEWARLNGNSEIDTLYPDSRIAPSEENAHRWKRLLNEYRQNNP